MTKECIILCVLVWAALTVSSQPTQQAAEWEWYLDEVVDETFVGRYDFEYYYMPSTQDMEQQRSKGEVSYFLNTPAGLNSKKARDLIDRIMASYDDIKAVSEWHMTTGNYWKEFRFDKNKFRFTVKRKALDDGTYYVSITESANYYKSLGKKSQTKNQDSADKPAKRSTRDRRRVSQEDVDDTEEHLVADGTATPVVSEKERRRAAREREQALEQEQRMAKRRAQEQQREQEKALKEAEKQKKAEEKKQKAEEKRLKKEEEKRQREQARQEREQQRQQQAAAQKQAATPKPAQSRYHYDDVALWLSEKYDFTQTAGDGTTTCTMYSTAVKDVEMAKLAIKNALKGSNARMAVPWRLNNETQEVETGYTVDGHVLVFALGKNADGNITLTITEVSADEFDVFKQNLN